MRKVAQATLIAALLCLMAGSLPANADTLNGTFSSATYSGATFYVVYIKNQAGAFIKTLRLWGRTTSDYMPQLTDWVSVSNMNVTDAVTGATARGAVTNQSFVWNGKNANGAAVPNGTYSLVVEAVENNRKNHNTVATPFVFDGTSKTVTNAGSALLKNITINIVGNNTPVNRAPVITSATAVTCTTSTTKTYTVTATDADNNPITFTASGLPSWITFASPTLTLRPVTESLNTTVVIIASDGKEGLDTLRLAVTVTERPIVNKAPTFTCATSVTCTTGTRKTFTVTATDADNDPITFSGSGLPGWITFASPTLTLRPITGSTNTTAIIIAADGKGGLDTLRLAVTVSDGSTENNAPIITSAASVTCTTGTTKRYTVTATDAESDLVTFTTSTLPDWITFTSPILTFRPVTGSTSTTTTIIAADGKGGFDTLRLTISIFERTTTNNAPIITSAAAATCTTGTTKTYTVTATDADNDPITFSVSSLPRWITFTSPTLTLKPVTGSRNTTITIIASDGKRGFDTLRLAVTVVNGSTSTSGSVFNEVRAVAFTIGNSSFRITVKGHESISINLFTLDGTRTSERIVLSSERASSRTTLFQSVKPGIYLVKVTSPQGSIQQKVFIGR
jgi:hypothetical protein